jgi:transposase, IS6 family
VLLSGRRDAQAARRFFARALGALKVIPTEVVTDAASIYPGVIVELLPEAWHHVERYANNRTEADHGQLKRLLRPMRGLKTDRTAQVVIAGHALVQNLRRGPLRPRRRRQSPAARRRGVHRTTMSVF